MKTVKFSGHSDDIVQVTDAKGKDDEIGAYAGKGVVHACLVVGGRIRVRALYDGCWSFSIGQVAEDVPLPDWPIRFLNEHGYSVRLEIDVPDECATIIEEKDDQ